jgi:hypothetical protein
MEKIKIWCPKCKKMTDHMVKGPLRAPRCIPCAVKWVVENNAK